MAYDVSTYRALINEVGEGELANRLLDKWLKSDDLSTWANLADAIYHSPEPAVQKPKEIQPLSGLGGNRETREIRRWRVVLWYLSSGYTPQEVANQLHCTLHTIKTHIKYAQKDLKLPGRRVEVLVAAAIRQGLIP